MTVSTFVPTAAGNQSVNTYTGAIDGDISVLTRLGVAFAPHAQATPNMTVALDAGHIFNGNLTEVPPQTTAAIAAPTTNPRIDRVVIDRLTGVASVVTGTESETPVAPAFPTGTVPVARVLLQPAMTVITNDAITDERSLYSLGSFGSTGGGGLLNVQTFATPGTYTYTPTAGTTKVIVEVQGAGGGGGGAQSNANTANRAAGSGGGAGAYAKSFLTSGFSGSAVIVGARGLGSYPANGAGSGIPGGLSKFGTMTAPGGTGGNFGNPTGPQFVQPSRGHSVPATGGNLVNSAGAEGGRGYIVQASSLDMGGGYGGSSHFGAGGLGSNANGGVGGDGGVTGDALSPGAGGGGATSFNTTFNSGGNGGDGIVIVYEYA
jgi:hypothetical protein